MENLETNTLFNENLYDGLDEKDSKEKEIYPIKDIKIDKKAIVFMKQIAE